MKITPPIAPSTVFLGLISGISLCLPINIPVKYAKVSLPHELIEIEFTETAYNEDEEMLRKAIRVLNEKGFSASIDDFGSGYSSLSLLENLKFDVLKLDKSLIDTVLQNNQSKIVVTNIVRMAKELDMHIVAEGVETRETLQVLKELDCDLIQGFYFDKPLSREEFEQRLRNKQYKL